MNDEASVGSSALEVPLILLVETDVFGLCLGRVCRVVLHRSPHGVE